MDPAHVVAGRLSHPALWSGSELARVVIPGVSTGFTELDAEFPGGGWPAGSLTEIMPACEGIGELRILGPALAGLSARGRHLVWIAPPYLPYAPALAAAGVDLARLFIVRTGSEREALWALEQALRSNACGAALAWLPSPTYPELRRLQLAAGGSSTLALLFRPSPAANESSPAVLRIALASEREGLAVRILKRRGAPLARPILLAPAAQRSHHHAMDCNSSGATAARSVPARLTAV
jgi:hypothetical protein